MDHRRRKAIQKCLQVSVIAIVLLLFLFPIIWTFITSIKDNVTAWSMPPRIFFSPSASNYVEIFKERGLHHNIKNSIIVALGATAISLVLGTPLAYMFARTRYRFNNFLFIFVFASYILPPIVLSIPLYVAAARVGLLNTYLVVILAHSSFCMAFTVWMLRGFFEEIPVEIEECAKVDGCSNLMTLFKVTLPIARPGLVATVIFCIILSWNDFMYALVLTGMDTRTLPVAVGQFLTPHGMFWGQMCAAGVIATAPVLVFSLFFQRYLIRGMTAGAVKG